MAWENLPSTNTPLNAENLLNNVYPVGSIYMSVNSTNPGTLFGGTWEQLKDRFLLSAGDVYSAGSTGGEATHTLTINEMPSHDHGQRVGIAGGTGSYAYNIFLTNAGATSAYSGQMEGGGVSTFSNGGGQPHNIMPPYLAVYMWKRTA